MEMWLKQGELKLWFPVLPSEYKVSSSQANTTVNINALGEVNLLGKKGLRTVSFSSFFPHCPESYCEFYQINQPKVYVTQLERMKQNGPMKLYISNSISMDVTIESFEFGESDGTGDIQYTLELKEYRNIVIPVSVPVTAEEVPQVSETGVSGTSASQQPAAYTVVKGDTLSGIARKILGTANWQALYEVNKQIIGSNPNMIQVGMVLTIPQ